MENSDTCTFHIQLLSNTVDMEQYPFIKLIIENDISKEEYKSLLNMLQYLNDKYDAQKEEGLIDFTSLLIHFAGMLNEKLDPNDTIQALKKEGYYPSLMNEFIDILYRYEARRRRR
ncbi:DUF1878 family protein [Oceanobacillus piezotolerans]|uniref:DUF1878 family protein n=1 Tax=Oceanobacillus piezotolerans TaxID=2448030 RepID=A0A498DJ20_9BACI|nr:DUF1878 family protein [Oceanobacillus piezotolerans]RLL45505.1 DUF1878 family protein [Oceanobacillus piezotolerans]